MFNFELKKINKAFNFNIFSRFNIDYSSSWIIIFIIFIILNFVILFFSVSLYYKISKGEAFVVSKKTEDIDTIVKIDKKDLNEIIYNFSTKNISFDELKGRKNLFVIDPSI